MFCGLGRLLDALERFQFGPDELDWLERPAHRDDDHARVAGRPTASPATSMPTGKGSCTGRVAGPDRRGDLRRGRPARDHRPVDPQPRLGRGGGRGAIVAAAGGPADHRDGQPADRSGRGRGRGPGRLPRRLRQHVQPGGGAPVRHPDGRHRGPRLHHGVPDRAGGVRRPGRGARARKPPFWSTPTTPTEGIRNAVAVGRRRISVPYGSTPATWPARPAGPAGSSTNSGPRTLVSSSRGTSTSTRIDAPGRRAGRRLRRRHRGRHGRRAAHRRIRVQAGGRR